MGNSDVSGEALCDKSFLQATSKDSHDLEVASPFLWARNMTSLLLYSTSIPIPLTMVTHYVLPILRH